MTGLFYSSFSIIAAYATWDKIITELAMASAEIQPRLKKAFINWWRVLWLSTQGQLVIAYYLSDHGSRIVYSGYRGTTVVLKF